MFKFRLQPLLEYRKLQEENAQQEFALKLRELENEKKALASIAGERAVLARRFMQLSAGKSEMKADDLANLTSRLELLRLRQIRQENIVIEKDREKEISRISMLDTMRNKRIMELLRERHLGNYRLELKRRETRMLDEYGIRGYVRGSAI